MSLDCYPLGTRQSISHPEQPVAIEVAYHDNLFITITNQPKTIQVYDLSAKEDGDKLHSSIELNEEVLVEQLIYCRQGDYLAFIGDKDGESKLYTVFNWRDQCHEDPKTQAIVKRLEIKSDYDSNIDSNENLYCIDACQRTGNLAIGCACSVLIYRYYTNNVIDGQPFEHIVTINLSISARKISLLENYLAVTAVDHVQVLKLELLTLQLQTDSFEVDHQQTFNSGVSSITPTIGKTTETTSPNQADSSRSKSISIHDNASNTHNGDKGAGSNNNNNDSAQVAQNVKMTPIDRTSKKTGTNSSTSTGLTTCSFLSRSESETTTNFSSLLGDEGFNGLEFNKSDISIVMIQNQQQAQVTGNNNNSAVPAVIVVDDPSNDDCITWNLNTKKLVKLPTLMHNTSTNLSSYHVCHPLELLGPASESIACRVKASIFSTEFCQNQLEAVVLLCKQCEFDKDPVKSLHLVATYLANQDAQRRIYHQRSNPAQSSSTQGSAAPNVGGADAHEIVAAGMTSNSFGNHQTATGSVTNHGVINNDQAGDTNSECEQLSLLKSNDYDLLASVTCFVATLTSCFVYALHGKKVTKLQTITYPDVCLDLRPDILNVHILTPLGLQICSNGICDTMLRYDWSSSADLNLNFIAINRVRVLTTERYVILVASQATSGDAIEGGGKQSCIVEYMEKPELDELHSRFLHTLNRCSSVSVRSNMLTYLHASTQLAISCNLDHKSLSNNDLISMLKSVTIMLCKQLFLKKQSNVITNNRIDKAIKHLLDISFCNLSELMSRHLTNLITSTDNICATANQLTKAHTCYQSQVSLCGHDGAIQPGCRGNNEVSDENDASSEKISYELTDQKRSSTAAAVGGSGEDSNRIRDGQSNLFTNSCEASVDTDYELIKIYLKHAKHSQCLLDYLLSQSTNEQVCARTIGYIFDHNPRMLIKCAQRYPIDASVLDKSTNSDINSEKEALAIAHRRIMWILAERLKQLAEFDSTGINRATVLFILAILYEALGERQQCLRSLEQIKPFQHLAITMRSNHELSHSIAPVVREKYPDAYELFLVQLAKRDPVAADKFASTYGPASQVSQSGHKRTNNKTKANRSSKCNGIATIDAINDEETMDGFGNQDSNDSSDNDDEEADNEYVYERKLKLFSELDPSDIIDLLTSVGFDEKETADKHEATRAHIKASINLLESQYLLDRLNENYAHPT